MKLDECRALRKGAMVTWLVGNGWHITGKYIKLVEEATFPSMTFSDLMNGNFSLDNGKKSLKAMVEYMDDGRVRTEYISPRKLRRVQAGGNDGI